MGGLYVLQGGPGIFVHLEEEVNPGVMEASRIRRRALEGWSPLGFMGDSNRRAWSCYKGMVGSRPFYFYSASRFFTREGGSRTSIRRSVFYWSCPR